MHLRFFHQISLAALFSITSVCYCTALTINLQYPASPLFSSGLDPVAKAAINAAASDLSAAVTTSLNAVTTDAYSGASGGAEVTLGFEFSYLDPVTNVQTTISNATIGANIVNLFIGARNLTGNTLAVSSPGFVQLDESQTTGSGTIPNGLPGAVAIANSKAQTAYLRGATTVVDTAEGFMTLGSVMASIEVDFGITNGSVSFDWDGNNNGAKDTDTQLNNYWHFDHTTSVAACKNDLYSVALHEMMHTLGIGSSVTWEAVRSGTNWTGSNVIAITGSGANLINAAGDHAVANLMSRRISDGVQQEVLIDPNITTGSRKLLTELDLAFLRDIGHSTIIPTFTSPPGDFDGDGDVDGDDLTLWRNWYAINANGDGDNDGDTDGRDFLIWQRNYTGATTLAAVPEPNSLVSVLAMAMLISLRFSLRVRK